MGGRVGGILLAAGRSRRFGSDKREALLPGGESVLALALASLRGAVDELVLVIGVQDRESDYRSRFPDVRVLRAPRSAGGMGFSLADAVQQCGSWSACLVSLADKPFVRPDTALRVRHALQTHALVVPAFEGAGGHPAGFARQHFHALAGLEGEAGARALIAAERARCLFLEVEDPGVVADIDTPEDLAYWGALLGA